MQSKLIDYFMNPAIVDYVCITQVIGFCVQENKQKMSSADYKVLFEFTRKIKDVLANKDEPCATVAADIVRLIAAVCDIFDKYDDGSIRALLGGMFTVPERAPE